MIIKETLWELGETIHGLQLRIEAAGELLPEMEAEMDQLLADKLPHKLLQCSMWRGTLEHNISWLRSESARLAERARMLEREHRDFGRYMASCLVRADLKGARAPDGSRSWHWREYESTVVDDATLLPESVLVPQPPKVDLDKVKRILKSDFPLQGAHLESKIGIVER